MVNRWQWIIPTVTTIITMIPTLSNYPHYLFLVWYSCLLQMTKDQFANYVVQKMLDIAEPSQRKMLVYRLKPHFLMLKKFTYAKHIVNKIERLSKCGAPSSPVATYFWLTCLILYQFFGRLYLFNHPSQKAKQNSPTLCVYIYIPYYYCYQ